MFAKVFEQIFDSSIAEHYLVRLVFEDFLVLADPFGVVDMTQEAIARRTNVPIEIVRASIHKLSQPDPRSRSPKEQGRRLTLLDDHRDWGWQIVNYPEYRKLRNEENRRDYMRDYMRNRRKQDDDSVNASKQPVSAVNNVSGLLAQEEEVVEVKRNPSPNADALRGEPESFALVEPTRAKPRFTTDDVEEIYQAYPRHVGKGDAKKAIEKTLKRIDSDNPVAGLLGIVREYAGSPAGQNGSFTPYPATWFNESRYLDDPCEWEKTSGGGR